MNLEFHKVDCSRRGEITVEVMEFDSREDWQIEHCLECGTKVLLRRLPKQKNNGTGGREARVGVEMSEA